MAEVKEGKLVTLYLESWQKRMIKDYLKSMKLPIVFNKAAIDFRKPVHLNTYRVPYIKEPLDDGIDIYFTDAQKEFLEEVTGLRTVDAMHINKAALEEKIVVFH